MATVQAAPNTVTIEEAKAHLEELVGRAQHGEELVITNAAGQPVAKLAALTAVTPTAETPNTDDRWLFGLMPGIELLPGWDDPLEEFAEYM